MALDALIFDVDGTLMDTNDSHVQAWGQAFEQLGYHISPDRIAVEIGKGGDKLVPSILGQHAHRKDGAKLAAARGKAFAAIARSTKLPMFSGVERLLATLRERGVKTALATSSKLDDLHTIQASAGVSLTTLVDHVITADDAAESKPSPDLVSAAVSKLGLSPAQCAMVGDTPHDIEAARDAGLVTLAMICGDLNDAPTLRAAGARAVYHDPADLYARLDDALAVASPGAARLTTDRIDQLMREALQVAAEGLDHGEAPIGCVLARGDGTIIARGYNTLNASNNKTAHAEIVAFANAAGRIPPDARDLILVSTLEPCVMCLGAAMESAVDTVLFALPAPADGGTHRVRPPVSEESQMPRILAGILAEESRALFETFLKRKDLNPSQESFTRELLKATR